MVLRSLIVQLQGLYMVQIFRAGNCRGVVQTHGLIILQRHTLSIRSPHFVLHSVHSVVKGVSWLHRIDRAAVPEKDTRIVVRVTQSEKDRLQKLADEMGVTISQYIRLLIKHAPRLAISREEDNV